MCRVFRETSQRRGIPCRDEQVPAPADKFPARAKKIRCAGRAGNLGVEYNPLEMLRELTPGSAGLAGNSKNSLPNSLPPGIQSIQALPSRIARHDSDFANAVRTPRPLTSPAALPRPP